MQNLEKRDTYSCSSRTSRHLGVLSALRADNSSTSDNRVQLINKEELTGYVRNHTMTVGSGVLCNLCGKVMLQSSVRRHFMDRHCFIGSGLGYHCPSCQKIYKSKNSMVTHISTNHRDWGGKIDVDQFLVTDQTMSAHGHQPY